MPQGVWKEGKGGPELQGRHPQTFPLTDVCMKPTQHITPDDDKQRDRKTVGTLIDVTKPSGIVVP